MPVFVSKFPYPLKFFADPIEIENIIYAKAPLAKTIFAIAPSDGSTIGKLSYGTSPVFSQTYIEYHSGVYETKEAFLFFENDMIYAFKK
jgi:hypothetical protein